MSTREELEYKAELEYQLYTLERELKYGDPKRRDTLTSDISKCRKELAILSLKKKISDVTITMEIQQKMHDETSKYLQKRGKNGGYVSSGTYTEYSRAFIDLRCTCAYIAKLQMQLNGLLSDSKGALV